MSNVLRLEREKTVAKSAAEPAGELVAMPFVDLPTVLKTLQMLRKYPNQDVLDNFNRAAPAHPS
jgi:hypothetical protein